MTFLVFVVSCGPCKESKPKKTVSKEVTGKREADFLEMTENYQILLANQQIHCIFLTNFKCKHNFSGSYQNDRSKTFITMPCQSC